MVVGMTRETVRDKGLRYLAEGRLVIQVVKGDLIQAWCRGGGEVYPLGWNLRRGWWCDCPARGPCAHLFALQLVTVTDRRSTQENSP
jgi:uncharacterized Zn finger protein